MAEIKLICPGCLAEYVLPEGAIPPAGRNVECSSCGRVWQAQRPASAAPLDLASYTLTAPPSPPRESGPAEGPVLPAARQRLSPTVLDILRDEVEHERRLREAEGDAPTADTGHAATGVPEGAWPAATMTIPAGATRAIIASPQPQVPPLLAPAVIRHPAIATRTPDLVAPRMAGESAAPPAGSARRRRAAGYRAGFSLMAVIAASAVGLYAFAPDLADQGIAEPLMEWRAEVDRARLWLDAQVARLRG